MAISGVTGGVIAPGYLPTFGSSGMSAEVPAPLLANGSARRLANS